MLSLEELPHPASVECNCIIHSLVLVTRFFSALIPSSVCWRLRRLVVGLTCFPPFDSCANHRVKVVIEALNGKMMVWCRLHAYSIF